jgi:hypothetical protein
MNNENLEYLQETLKYLGFGEKQYLNHQLSERIALQQPMFELDSEVFFTADHKLEITLYFRRSEQLDMYFFNKYDARLRSADDPDLDRAQTFYISKGTGVTLKESFNLLLGRSVNKNLYSMEGEKYNAWIQLDFGEKDKYGNYKVKQFREQFGYDLEKTLDKYPIRELRDPELKAELIRSLRKGNRHTVTFEKKDNKIDKFTIEANPHFKTINLYPCREAVKTEPAAAQTRADSLHPRPNRKDQKERQEEEKEEFEEGKELESELADNKQPGRKKIHK